MLCLSAILSSRNLITVKPGLLILQSHILFVSLLRYVNMSRYEILHSNITTIMEYYGTLFMSNFSYPACL